MPAQPQAHRLELEGQVVGEGAVEAQVRLVGMVEQGDQGPERGEHRRLAAALLLDEPSFRRAHDRGDGVGSAAHALHRVEGAEGLGDRAEQDLAPRVQRLDLERAAPSGEDERRVGEAHVPARVAARILVARGEQAAPMRVEILDEGLDGVGDGDRVHRAVDADASPGEVAVGAHGRALPLPGVDLRGSAKTRAAPRGAAPGFVCSVARVPDGPPLRGTTTTTSTAGRRHAPPTSCAGA